MIECVRLGSLTILVVLLGLTLSFERHVPASAALNESQGQARVNGRHGFRKDMIKVTDNKAILSVEHLNM